jgi:hypothetical protein
MFHCGRPSPCVILPSQSILSGVTWQLPLDSLSCNPPASYPGGLTANSEGGVPS